jgi:hypothetical protein
MEKIKRNVRTSCEEKTKNIKTGDFQDSTARKNQLKK